MQMVNNWYDAIYQVLLNELSTFELLLCIKIKLFCVLIVFIGQIIRVNSYNYDQEMKKCVFFYYLISIF